MKIHYNAPAILTFSLLATAVMGLSALTGGESTTAFFVAYPDMSFADPFTYLRLFSHVLGHADWSHLVGNFSLILLIGPLLEEKYGSQSMVIMIVATAFITGLLNSIFFPTGLLGASGVVFMLILLSSFANIRSGSIPLTFIIVAILYVGKEVVISFQPDNVSQFAHILGGICGSIFGFALGVGKSDTVNKQNSISSENISLSTKYSHNDPFHDIK